MWARVKEAAEDGLVFGVKALVFLLVLLFGLSWFLGDYTLVRQRAMNGQWAAEQVQRLLAQPPQEK